MNMLVFALLALVVMPAAAQEMPMAAPVCSRDAEPIPAVLAAWSNN